MPSCCMHFACVKEDSQMVPWIPLPAASRCLATLANRLHENSIKPYLLMSEIITEFIFFNFFYFTGIGLHIVPNVAKRRSPGALQVGRMIRGMLKPSLHAMIPIQIGKLNFIQELPGHSGLTVPAADFRTMYSVIKTPVNSSKDGFKSFSSPPSPPLPKKNKVRNCSASITSVCTHTHTHTERLF